MPKFERWPAFRVVATPEALDRLDGDLLRLAPDEALLLLEDEAVEVDDEHAIIVRDHSFVGAWFEKSLAAEILARHCEWEPPSSGFAQGAVAGIPTKLWFRGELVLMLVQAPYAVEFEERLR